MQYEKRTNLSRSDFGEVMREVYEGTTFKYALLRYERGTMMVNSEQYYLTLRDQKVVPGSVAIEYDKILKYKIDPATQQRVQGEDGKDVLMETGRWGWSLVTLKSIEAITAEALIEGQINALEYDKQTIAMRSKLELVTVEQKILAAMNISPDLEAKVLNQLELEDEDDDKPQSTNGQEITGTEITPAGNIVEGTTTASDKSNSPAANSQGE